MKRRKFIKFAGVGVALAAAPWACSSTHQSLVKGEVTANGAGKPIAGLGQRPVVLIEFNGGNDGLNTVVPYTDDAYYEARPRLAIGRDSVLQLSDTLGLNPELEPLMSMWDNKQIAVVSGVGYENPNRSHFRSIEIWETGSDSEEYLTEGWVSRALSAPHGELAADGVIVGNGAVGPLGGGDLRNVAMHDPEEFMREARRLTRIETRTQNTGLDHVIGVQNQLIDAGKAIETHLSAADPPATVFPRSGIGRQLEVAARLITADVPVAVIKVQHGSFDTHANQPNVHNRLLRELADGLAAFQQAMDAANRWNDVLVMTYSEFGRRVSENGSRGTDHGTAAPHLFMGGNVNGGLYGAQPSLTDLDDGDLKFTTDYRALYNTLASDWWSAGKPFADYGVVDGILG